VNHPVQTFALSGHTASWSHAYTLGKQLDCPVLHAQAIGQQASRKVRLLDGATLVGQDCIDLQSSIIKFISVHQDLRQSISANAKSGLT